MRHKSFRKKASFLMACIFTVQTALVPVAFAADGKTSSQQSLLDSVTNVSDTLSDWSSQAASLTAGVVLGTGKSGSGVNVSKTYEEFMSDTPSSSDTESWTPVGFDDAGYQTTGGAITETPSSSSRPYGTNNEACVPQGVISENPNIPVCGTTSTGNAWVDLGVGLLGGLLNGGSSSSSDGSSSSSLPTPTVPNISLPTDTTGTGTGTGSTGSSSASSWCDTPGLDLSGVPASDRESICSLTPGSSAGGWLSSETEMGFDVAGFGLGLLGGIPISDNASYSWTASGPSSVVAIAYATPANPIVGDSVRFIARVQGIVGNVWAVPPIQSISKTYNQAGKYNQSFVFKTYEIYYVGGFPKIRTGMVKVTINVKVNEFNTTASADDSGGDYTNTDGTGSSTSNGDGSGTIIPGGSIIPDTSTSTGSDPLSDFFGNGSSGTSGSSGDSGNGTGNFNLDGFGTGSGSNGTGSNGSTGVSNPFSDGLGLETGGFNDILPGSPTDNLYDANGNPIGSDYTGPVYDENGKYVGVRDSNGAVNANGTAGLGQYGEQTGPGGFGNNGGGNGNGNGGGSTGGADSSDSFSDALFGRMNSEGGTGTGNGDGSGQSITDKLSQMLGGNSSAGGANGGANGNAANGKYQRDANGNYLRDANGNLIPVGNASAGLSGVTVKKSTEQLVRELKTLIDTYGKSASGRFDPDSAWTEPSDAWDLNRASKVEQGVQAIKNIKSGLAGKTKPPANNGKQPQNPVPAPAKETPATTSPAAQTVQAPQESKSLMTGLTQTKK